MGSVVAEDGAVGHSQEALHSCTRADNTDRHMETEPTLQESHGYHVDNNIGHGCWLQEDKEEDKKEDKEEDLEEDREEAVGQGIFRCQSMMLGLKDVVRLNWKIDSWLESFWS